MNTRITKLLFFIAVFAGFVFANTANSQTRTQTQKLNELSKKFQSDWDQAHQRVVEYAVRNKIEIWHETEDGRVMELVDIRDGKPVYYITDNRGADATTRVDQLWPGGSLNLAYSGEGYFQLGEWDAGHVRKSHQEFTDGGVSRAFPQDGNYATHYHSTHVAGTMIAAGINPDAKGALYGGKLKYWQWSADDSEMAAAAAAGLEISNHSYGFLAGWNYNNGNWTWYGNSAIDPNEDYKFGFYNSDAKKWDQIAWNAPNYLIVKSAGNDRGEGPGDAGNGKPEKDGGDDGYDCIASRGVAKNLLTVGAVYEVNPYEGPSSVQMSSFSCWGPADDGRIKPDIVGKGVDVFSTLDGSNTDYGVSQGTSMSAPNVSGSLAMLQYHYQQTHSGTPMRAATLKGLAIHTASEAGDYPGPDYMFGWGLLNAEFAAEIISDDQGQNVIDELVLNSGDLYSREVFVPGGSNFKVTICWTDPPGTPVSPQLDPPDPMLVNNLDLRVLDANSTTHYPWKLDKDNPSAAATNNSKNGVDNVEKIEIDNAAEGTYTIYIDYDGALSGGSQAYSIIISGIDDYTVVPECSAGLIDPVDGGTDANLNHKLTWTPALFASSYDVYLGTDGGGTSTPTNVLNGDNFQDNSVSVFLNKSTTYYLQVVPRNSQGTASGCDDIWSFTTMDAISAYPYEQGMEDVSTPDLPVYWQSYDYSDQKWLSTSLIANTGSKAMSCYYDGGLVEFDYDNWFVSPPFEVNLGNEYNASFYYKGFIPGHSESMSVYWGYTPYVADLNNVIIENGDITDANFTLGEGLIIPNTDTIVFLGFHLNSTNGYGAFLDDIKMENWGPVGINNNSAIADPMIYSINKQIIVKTDESWEGADIDVISILGQKLLSKKHIRETDINMSSFDAGIYLVRIASGNKTYIKKMIIK
jgi:hypothetical protein